MCKETSWQQDSWYGCGLRIQVEDAPSVGQLATMMDIFGGAARYGKPRWQRVEAFWKVGERLRVQQRKVCMYCST